MISRLPFFYHCFNTNIARTIARESHLFMGGVSGTSPKSFFSLFQVRTQRTNSFRLWHQHCTNWVPPALILHSSHENIELASCCQHCWRCFVRISHHLERPVCFKTLQLTISLQWFSQRWSKSGQKIGTNPEPKHQFRSYQNLQPKCHLQREHQPRAKMSFMQVDERPLRCLDFWVFLVGVWVIFAPKKLEASLCC